jgi:hypothetical protein
VTLFSTTGNDMMLDYIKDQIAFASLHSDDPGNTGANELVGGDPAYARMAVAFGPAALGAIRMTSNPSFDVPAGSSIRYAGFYTAGGTFLAKARIRGEFYRSQSTYILSAVELNVGSVA